MTSAWRKKVPPLLPLVSAVVGALVFIFSLTYMLGAVALQEEAITLLMDSCKKDSSPKPCKYLMEVTGAGVIGCLFSACQAGLSGWMHMKKNILRLWKVWVLSNLVLFIFMLTTACLVFHVYDESICGPRARTVGGRQKNPYERCKNAEENTCFRHLGCNQLSVGGGNFVVMFYGLLTFFNSLFLLGSGIMIYLIVKKIDVPIQSIAASLTDNSQPSKVDSRAASKAPSKVTQKASQTKPSSASMKK